MRRKDRQVTDFDEIAGIVAGCEVCRLGLIDGDTPYIVPLNFGFELAGGALTLYFHCAREGRKLDILRRNPRVCFELDRGHVLVTGARACDYSFRYESVIGVGTAEFVESFEEKAHALAKILAHYAAPEENLTRELTDLVAVLRVRSTEFTAKRS